MNTKLLLLACTATCALAQQAQSSQGINIKQKVFEWKHKQLSGVRTADDVKLGMVFNQKLDHFDPADNRVFRQQYFANADFYEEGGPIFLMIGGEGDATLSMIRGYSWREYAKEHKAMQFVIEHRYYGDTRPTEDMSTENLQYLSDEQALEDYAHFITEMNYQYNFTNPKWIAMGGSYAGSLAGFLAQKYPHLVHAAVATSGPVLAKADFFEYHQVVGKALQGYENCHEEFQSAMSMADELLKQGKVGWKKLEETLGLCSALDGNDPKAVSQLFENLSGAFAGVVQYNSPTNGLVTTQRACATLVNGQDGSGRGSSLERMRDLITLAFGDFCINIDYDLFIAYMQDQSWDNVYGGYRQWLYQTCTEYGWYQTLNQPGHPYSDNLRVEYYEQMCEDIYGSTITPTILHAGIGHTNLEYGAKHPVVDNVLFVHGGLDPWSAMGILEDLSPSSPALVIEGQSHCSDMYYPNPQDAPALIEARLIISAQIGEWMAQE